MGDSSSWKDQKFNQIKIQYQKVFGGLVGSGRFFGHSGKALIQKHQNGPKCKRSTENNLQLKHEFTEQIRRGTLGWLTGVSAVIQLRGDSLPGRVLPNT